MKKAKETAKKSEKFDFTLQEDTSLNLAASILKHYGIESENSSLSQADGLLARNYPHIVVVMIENLGMKVMEENLNYRDFFNRHLLTDYKCTFPGTSRANKEAFLYESLSSATFKDKGKTEEKESIIEKINKSGKAKAEFIEEDQAAPFKGIYDFTGKIKKSLKTNDNTFTFAVWTCPDKLLNDQGYKTKEANKYINEINTAIYDLCEDCKNTLFFITGDHGLKEIQNVFLEEDYPELMELQEKAPLIEERSIQFFVSSKNQKKFRKMFYRFFEEDYLLTEDFTAYAKGSRTIVLNKKEKTFRALGGGITEDELKIPLIWYENRPKKTGLIIYYTIIALIVFFIGYLIFV